MTEGESPAPTASLAEAEQETEQGDTPEPAGPKPDEKGRDDQPEIDSAIGLERQAGQQGKAGKPAGIAGQLFAASRHGPCTEAVKTTGRISAGAGGFKRDFSGFLCVKSSAKVCQIARKASLDRGTDNVTVTKSAVERILRELCHRYEIEI